MKTRISFILIYCYFFWLPSITANSTQDSLLRVIESARTPDSTKAKTLIALGWELKYENTPQAKNYCNQGLILARKLKRNKDIADGLKLRGIIADLEGDTKTSIDMYLQSIVYYKLLKDTLSIAKSEYNIGVLYLDLDQNAEAKKYFYRCLSVFEQQKFLPGIQLVTENIGIYCFNIQNFDSALYYFEKSKQYGNLNNNVEPGIIGNIGNCYYSKNDFTTAKKYLTQCIQMYEANRNPPSNMYNYKSSLAGTLAGLGDTNGALALYEECKAAYLKLGMYYSDDNSKVLTHMSYDYAKVGNFSEAYKNASEANKIKDSLIRADFAGAINEMKEKYEAEKNEISIHNLNKETKLKDEVITNQSRQKIGLGIGLLIMLAFIFILNKNIANKKRAHQIIQKQKELVDEKNKEIIDSISYAKRLQNAILPPENLIRKYLPNSFLIYKPKDIVAGDFYWFDITNDELFIAAADSTGHGVPGAIVSVVCSNALHRTLNEFKITDTGMLLDKTRELVLETFSKSEDSVKDGMDISLLSIKRKKSGGVYHLNWSGANNSLVYIQDGVLKILKAHKQAIGATENPSPFPTNTLELKSGDSLYLFTDGFADQFGGPSGKKFRTKNLEQLLLNNHTRPMNEFKEGIEKAFEDWKGDLEQVDDVCVIGIRLE